MIKSVLVANRGEIACRIIHTAKQLGLYTVAVYSAADQDALHVQLADEAVYLGESLQETYLNAEKLIALAKEMNIDAIHPGYGFLSENANFSALCEAANVIFVGPSSRVIALMGMKDAAKAWVAQVGLPLLPGYHGDLQTAHDLLKEAKHIGFPVLLKAAAGGGGKGMRIVRNEAEFEIALQAAKRESLASFGNDKILLEKYLEAPRHIEVQIAADAFGNVVHLFERDCSIQRRYQKIIEEAPATNLSDSVRTRLHEAAVKIAKAMAYQGVGTVECLLDGENFYFMEMNTRLQVEHPVTEMITGQDLVAWQFRIANGEALPLEQSEIKARGHAIEVRLCAEDPEKNFLPASGEIRYLHWPSHVRIETGVRKGDRISVLYDSMIAKMITWGETRDNAIAQMRQALDHTVIVGVATNRNFLRKILALPEFQAAKINTNFIHLYKQSLDTLPLEHRALVPALLAAYQIEKQQANAGISPWKSLAGFRLNQDEEWRFYFAKPEWVLTVTRGILDSHYEVKTSESDEVSRFRFSAIHEETSHLSVEINGRVEQARVIEEGNSLSVFVQGEEYPFQKAANYIEHEQAFDFSSVRAPIPGIIISILVKPQEQVKKGQALLLMEAMKMEHTLSAPADCQISEILCKVKQQVSEGTELIKLHLPE